MRIKTVLCPVDRSKTSEQAMAYAIAVARQFAARLSLLEVIDWTLPPVSGVGTEFLDMPPEVQTQVLAHLNSLAAPARDAGIATEVGVQSGPVVRKILERADEIGAGLIVLGTHGRSGFERLALGSVAEKILRKASCSVLTVPPAAGPPAETPFSRILCAVDLSPSSRDLLRVAAAFAVRFGGEIFVAHVVEWPFGPATGSDVGGGLLQGLEVKARDQLAALLADPELPPVKVSSAILTGRPTREILEGARARRADLIVMGVSGHGAIDRALVGSTTHGVIRESTCPVVTAR
jgi:nucleotide-binding universal stress UspA family protein